MPITTRRISKASHEARTPQRKSRTEKKQRQKTARENAPQHSSVARRANAEAKREEDRKQKKAAPAHAMMALAGTSALISPSAALGSAAGASLNTLESGVNGIARGTLDALEPLFPTSAQGSPASNSLSASNQMDDGGASTAPNPNGKELTEEKSADVVNDEVWEKIGSQARELVYNSWGEDAKKKLNNLTRLIDEKIGSVQASVGSPSNAEVTLLKIKRWVMEKGRQNGFVDEKTALKVALEFLEQRNQLMRHSGFSETRW